MNRVNVAFFQRFLQNLLKQHIERELFKIREKIYYIIEKLKQNLVAQKDEKLTINYIRVFFSRLIMRFYNFILSILNDNYLNNNTIFFDENDVKHHSKRIRVLIYRFNTKFFIHMKNNDQKKR